MTSAERQLVILMAEDDPDDRILTQQALRESAIRHELHFVEDGEELLRRLRGDATCGDRPDLPRPDLILLDWNMPRMGGREVLAELKADARLRSIPVIVFTTSRNDRDVTTAYEMGANSYIAKPVSFDGLTDLIKTLGCYWGQLVELP